MQVTLLRSVSLILTVMVISCQSQPREGWQPEIQVLLPQVLTHSLRMREAFEKKSLFFSILIQKGEGEIWSELLPTHLSNEIEIPASIFGTAKEEFYFFRIQIGEKRKESDFFVFFEGARRIQASELFEEWRGPLMIHLSMTNPFFEQADPASEFLFDSKLVRSATLKFFGDLR